MEFVIYADESDKKGKFFSNFYGGALVKGSDYNQVTLALSEEKKRLNILGEVKWNKTTKNYLEKYKCLMNEFFNFVAEDKVKIRIMFTQNVFVPVLTDEQTENSFQLLYYQFLKNAFGLPHSNETDSIIKLRILIDRWPLTLEKRRSFISFIHNLQHYTEFRRAKITIPIDQIADVDSHDHVILQCLDVILGAMSFRLNDKHLEIPEGKFRRGSKTRAKEQLYKYILGKIREIRPGFNPGTSTSWDGNPQSLWKHPYRHWIFKPKHSVSDGSKLKGTRRAKR